MNRHLFMKHLFHKRNSKITQDSISDQELELMPELEKLNNINHIEQQLPAQVPAQVPAQEKLQENNQIELQILLESSIKEIVNKDFIKQYKNSKKELKNILKKSVEIEKYLNDKNDSKVNKNNLLNKENIFI